MEKNYNQRVVLRFAVALVAVCMSATQLLAQSNQPLKAAFSQDKNKGCLPVVVQFTDNSTGTGLTYYWDFGNGNTSALRNPGAMYTAAGNYTVKLVVTDISGIKDSVVKQMAVRAFDNPQAAFTADRKSGCAGMQVSFTDTSVKASAPVVGWQWNFGDGAAAVTPAPKHNFASNGVFSVSLIITDSNGCKNFVNKAGYIQTTIPAQVAFTADSKGGCITPQVVNFSNKSTLQPGAVYSYKWSFGNGDSSVSASPSYSYTQNGNYNVSLTATDNNGCAATVSLPKYISIGKTKASFSIDAKKGCAPHTVNFTNTGIGIPSNATVVWYFGNGDSAIGVNAQYVYKQAGTYSVTMAVSSPSGCNDILVKKDSIAVQTAPTALFAHGNPISCNAGHTINFSSVNGNARSWLWDFGDGQISTLKNPVKRYDSSGVFTVTLTIKDSTGCAGTFVKKNLVKVNTQKASFTPSVNYGCVPLTVSFTNNSASSFGIKTYAWDLGDGNTSTTKNINAVYNNPGTYYPKLIITDNQGCTDTAVYDSIMVGVKTNPQFVADKTRGCKIDMRQVKFTNQTNITNQRVDAFFWDFGVITSTKVNPVVDYLQHPGLYTVSLVSVSNGCADTIIKKDYMHILMPHAQAQIIEDPCKLDTVVIKNQSKGGHLHNWVMNGQEISTAKDLKLFLSPGNYTFDYKLKDTATGCVDTRSYVLEVRKPMQPGFIQAADSICANVPLLLADTTAGAVASEWKIGSQPAITGKTISPLFSNPGLQNITLTVTDAFNCKESITKTKTVKVLGPDYTPLITPDKGCFPLDAQLIKTGTSAHGVAKAMWYDNGKKIETLADTVPFLFDTPAAGMNKEGITVYLVVTDNLGCKVIRGTGIKMSKPVAAISNQNDLKCDYTSVKFEHNAAASKHIGNLTYNWLLNDSIIRSTENFSSSFSKNTVAKVKLVVTEPAFGCTDSSVVTIPVSIKKLKAGFSVDKNISSCPPLVTGFADASSVENTTITAVKWWFGDSATSLMAKPSKTYFYPGQYHVSYKITDAQGCSDSITFENKIRVGGPTGTYFIDRYKGCVPFDANFTSQSQNAKTVKWDLGNGMLNTGAATQGHYELPGSYQPAMVLEDSAGCLVVYPVKDPIVGHTTPAPDFTVQGKCATDNFTFTNTTDTTRLPAVFEWEFEEKDKMAVFGTKKLFGKPGKHDVTLKATSSNGCEASITKTVEIQDLQAGFSTNHQQACRYTDITLTDQTIAGAGIKSRRWVLGDGAAETTPVFIHQFATPGTYTVLLVVEDQNGCIDSAAGEKGIVVFDSLTPPSVAIHRVTVQQNNTVRMEFAPYCKNDFGSYLIYRSLPGKTPELYKTINSQYDTVYIDDAVNTFAQSYTYKIYTQTFCGKTSLDGSSNTHTTVLLQTVADTNVVNLGWNSYEGWDAVRQYTVLRMGPGEDKYSAIATVPATETIYADTKVYCGNTYKYMVYAEKVSGRVLVSNSNHAGATPLYKVEVYPARIVRATVEDDKNTLVEFTPCYKQKTPVDYYTIEKSADGVNYATMYKTGTEWSYTDEKVDVHARSYYYRARTTDICGAVSEPGNIGKTILLSAQADEEDNVNVEWSSYQEWEEGIQSYVVEMADAGGNFNTTGTNNAADTMFTDASNLFNQLPRVCYRVKAVSNNGTVSYSNTGCARGRSSLFIPNAFTPNDDAHNNRFVVVGAYIKKYEINIYDRYGEKIFTGYSLEESWDGTYKGEPVQEGAYMYSITSLGMDNKHHNVSGTVTLFR